ncbi:MAG TPA: hypothetical protein VGX68_06840 [Thermoanaerobaculia bacterium]|nr:hypothetical protein [Thermoanaerobaculia bacterium]
MSPTRRSRRISSFCPFLLGLTLIPAQPAPAQQVAPPDASLETLPVQEPATSEPPKVRQIHVVTENIFDLEEPGEDKLLFRLADRFHFVTRPEVIERQVLLRPGDEYSEEQAAESERILRKNPYLYDARIRPVPTGEGEVDLEVVTRDVWTLQGGVGFRRSGGTNTVHFDVEDINFLGTGKAISVSHQTSVDRTANLIEYRDPNLFGTHGRLDTAYSANSDGAVARLLLERPFYSLDTRWALGLSANLDDRVDPLYDRGHVFDRFQHRQDTFEVYAGLSPGLANRSTHRWRTGFTYERDRFSTAEGFEPPSLIPADRTLAYPWLSYEFVNDGYFTVRDLDRLERTEDVNLGQQYHLRLGWSSPVFGGDANRLIADVGGSVGWRLSPRQLVLASLQGGSRMNRSVAENLLVGGRLRYYIRDFGNNLFYVSLGWDVAHDLDPENQLLLGGDTGLRGYPLRYLQGDNRVLFTVEQRFFSNRELFHLAHLGAAVFFDAGSAWFQDVDGKLAADRELLRDVGIGLRIGSSRSSARGTMVHLDLAFPLDGGRDVKSLQWLVSTKDTF